MPSQTTNTSPEQDISELPEQTHNVVEKDPESNPAQPLKITFPEGGLAAWSVVLGASINLGCAFGYLSSFG